MPDAAQSLPEKPGHVLFLTGDLAEGRLRRVLESMQPLDFQVSVANLGIKVAALATTEIVLRRLDSAQGADLVLLPGRFRGDLERLAQHFGARFERGPDEIEDLPQYFRRQAQPLDLSRYETRIFAEIVDAPRLDLAGIVARAATLRDEGADVIDLGCLPDTAFPHLEEAIAALQEAGHKVSVDSLAPDDLRRANQAGADYLLSLSEDTLDLAEEGEAVPILIPTTPRDMDSLARAVERFAKRDRPFLIDPILEPIHYGFTDSLLRYREARERWPEAEILMGIGNVTELTDADSSGVNAILMGVISELRIGAVLAVQVSPHCRRAVREFDAARRQFFAAREADSMPRGFGEGLLCLRDRKPFPNSPDAIAETAAMIRDRNYRIEVSSDGIHLYNRDGHHVAIDPFDLFPKLELEGDVGHAFYLGVELARAQIAWQLGKRYNQDNELRWGVAVDPPRDDEAAFHAMGPTRRDRKRTS